MEALEQKVIDMYTKEFCGQHTCAKRNNISIDKVVDILKKHNIHIRNKSESMQVAKKMNRTNKPKELQQWQKDKILQCYVEEHRGLEYTRKQAHCSLNQLKIFLQEQDIHRRSYGEAAVFSNQNRALHKNKQYFDIQTSNMAWILGFLAADGYLLTRNNTIGFGLSIADEEILHRIRKEMEIENPVRTYMTSNGFEYASLEWTCVEHRKALAEYSIVPNKTFILEPPYKLDKKYWIDYIRGYFDGDGSVNIIHTHGIPSALRWQVCSATPSILDFIVNILEEKGIQRVNIQKQNRKNRNGSASILYNIQYSTNSTKKIYDIIYGTDSTLFLKRKKDHYKTILTQYEMK